MSYCRWSTDDYQCDVYCYAHFRGFFAIHVAGNRIRSDAPRPPSIGAWWERGEAGAKEFAAREDAMHAWLVAGVREPIGLPHDGETFHEADAGAAAARLLYLRGLGYNVPQRAIDTLCAEHAEATAPDAQ